jgi:hypothetical protein
MALVQHTVIRGLVAVAIAAVVAAWVLASPGEAPALPDSPHARQAAADVERAAVVEASAARLRARLADMPARPEGARNPFQFEARRASLVPGVRRTVITDAPAAEEPPSAPVRPELRLIGMATDSLDGAVARTAVVSGLNQVYLVKEGEQIAMRFLVKHIDDHGIEVEDLVDSSTFTLGLR